MNICHVTISNKTMASFRYRVLIPGRELSKRGHTVYVGPTVQDDCEVATFSKHFRYSESKQASRFEGRVVFDICDDHFNSQHDCHYREMCQIADVIVAATQPLADTITEETGKDAIVIQDPYEFEEAPPSGSYEAPTLLWYGHPASADAFVNLKLPDDLELIVISDPAYLKSIPWSHANMLSGFARADAVILPVSDPKSRKKSGKSANRMVEAIRQGKFVIASEIEAYKPFADWMYLGDVEEGIEWLRGASRHEIHDRILAAQNYVREKFSPEAIADRWEAVYGAI